MDVLGRAEWMISIEMHLSACLFRLELKNVLHYK